MLKQKTARKEPELGLKKGSLYIRANNGGITK
jgi:hypothetical protein